MLDVKETELLVKQFDDESDDAENSAVWESHANNIIIGIEANDDVRPVRAIWEMVQNARDERKQDTLANMVFTRRKDTFVFQHDGEPFSKNALSSLIIQTSSKNKNEPEKVGKYGTGFLTTHKFGRVFLLDGSLCLKTGLAYFHNFNGFEIDRSSEDKVELGKIIKNKIEETKSWNKKLDQISHKAAEFTTFTYKHRDAQECENAKEAFQEAPSLIPYVIALNKGIGSIELVDEVEGSSSLFVRKGEYSEIEINDDYRLVKCQIGITVNGDELPSESIFMLESNNEFTTDGEPRVTVILPIHQTHNAYKAFDLGYNVPRLFLHLPLLGTDNWALNFIIHAPKFTCDKENRDNVRFSGNSEETVKKAEANRELLKLASKIIMQFIDRNLQMIENSKEFAVVKFRLQDANEKTKDYFSEQQTWWVAQMESRKFVNCDERLPVAEIKVLDMDLLEACEKDVSLLDAIYYFFERAVEFAPIHPRKEEMLFWSHTINDWYEDKDNSHFLTDYHIADMISKMSVHESDLDQLYIFEKYLVDSNKSKVFDEKNILPNIDLMLCAREEMLDAVSFTDNVMDVLRTLSPDTILHLVHPKFAKLLKLDSYNYDSLKNTLANRINDLLNLQKDSEVKKDKELYRFDATKYADSFFTNEIAAAILKLNMMIIDEDSSSVEAKMLPYLREFYSYDEIITERLDKDLFDRRTCCNALLRDALFKFTCMSVEEKDSKREWIGSLLSTLQEYKDLRDKILIHYEVCPDQLGAFCYADNLSQEDDTMREDLKDLYDRIIRKVDEEDLTNSIRHSLIDSRFNTMLPSTSITSGLKLASDLEDIVKNEYRYDLKDKQYTDEFVRIIKHLSGTDAESLVWQDLFKDINSKKGELLLSAIESERKKEHIFKYINTDEDRLELISSVMDNPRLADILKYGQEKILQQERDDNEFEFKKKLGKYVEKFLRDELAKVVGAIDVNIPVPIRDEQGGQDIVVRLGEEPVYYIEVKSRWGSEQVVRMSSSQHVKSIEEKANYALCVVNMCGYISEYSEEAIEKHIYPDNPSVIRDRMMVLTNIGQLNSRIKDACISGENQVYVESGYMVHVSQDVVKTNHKNFEVFVGELVKYLRNIVKTKIE